MEDEEKIKEYNKQIQTYLQSGKYYEATDTAEQLKKYALQETGESGVAYYESLNTLGQIYKLLRIYDKAEGVYKDALRIAKGLNDIFGPSNPVLITSLNNLAGIYVANNQLQEAIPLYEKSFETVKAYFDRDDKEYVNTICDLADAYKKIGNFDSAESLYRQALDSFERIVGKHNPYYTAVINNLALLYIDKKLYNKALEYFNTALEILKNSCGEDHEEVAKIYNNIAFICVTEEDFAAAERIMQKCLQSFKNSMGEVHPQYAAYLDSLAAIYSNQNKAKERVIALEQRVTILKKIYGEDNYELVLALIALGNAYNDCGEEDKGNELLRVAVDTATRNGW